MPEGEIDRIYLDAPGAESQGPAGGRSACAESKTENGDLHCRSKAVGAGLAAWGIHELIDSDRPESSAKPIDEP